MNYFHWFPAEPYILKKDVAVLIEGLLGHSVLSGVRSQIVIGCWIQKSRTVGSQCVIGCAILYSQGLLSSRVKDSLVTVCCRVYVLMNFTRYDGLMEASA